MTHVYVASKMRVNLKMGSEIALGNFIEPPKAGEPYVIPPHVVSGCGITKIDKENWEDFACRNAPLVKQGLVSAHNSDWEAHSWARANARHRGSMQGAVPGA